MIIAIDFDGTCVTHEYPEIGKGIGAVPVLKKLVEKKHQLILWTMRSRKCLASAVSWFEENGIELFGVNENPFQSSWTTSPKAFANIYIDDAGLDAPLLFKAKISNRPFIDWDRVEMSLTKGGLFK